MGLPKFCNIQISHYADLHYVDNIYYYVVCSITTSGILTKHVVGQQGFTLAAEFQLWWAKYIFVSLIFTENSLYQSSVSRHWEFVSGQGKWLSSQYEKSNKD